MSKKIDERIPQHVGKGVFPEYSAVHTPWDKLISFKETVHFGARQGAVVSAAILQALRIMIPDYEERAQLMCEVAYARIGGSFRYWNQMDPGGPMRTYNIHPFCTGAAWGGLTGDVGDDYLLMCGRCNDAGTYRVEKELDVCDWDICGSELCRTTTMSLQGISDYLATTQRKGPSMDYAMVEAKGCGDRHCRIVAESREKFPMPEHKLWESFGPIATADQIRETPEEDTMPEPFLFMEEANYMYQTGTNIHSKPEAATAYRGTTAATYYILPAIDGAIQRGIVSRETAMHILRCVMEAAGKAAWGNIVAKKALRDWLGVPGENPEDGRIMGGYLEVFLQTWGIDYTIEAFNKDEVVYSFHRSQFSDYVSVKHLDCLIPYWYGETKTLVNAQWSLWEEKDENPDICRIKIAKKIDKFC